VGVFITIHSTFLSESYSGKICKSVLIIQRYDEKSSVPDGVHSRRTMLRMSTDDLDVTSTSLPCDCSDQADTAAIRL